MLGELTVKQFPKRHYEINFINMELVIAECLFS